MAPPTAYASSLRRGLGWLVRICEWISASMFAALFLVFVAQVYWRYVLRDPLVWTLEVAGILFVTLSLFTAATQMRMRDHVALDLAVDLLPNRIAGLARAFSLWLFAAVMLASVPDTIEVLQWMYRERTFAIKFNLGHLFVLMIFFVVTYAVRAFLDGLRLARHGADTGA